MNATTIAASGSAALKTKIAAAGLAAALTAGGAAAVTGTLPGGAQDFAADAAGHVGLNLPRSEASGSVFGQARVQADEIISIHQIGTIGVNLDGDGLTVAEISPNAGVEASVLFETGDSIVVEFTTQAAVTTVVITTVDGEVVATASTEPLDLGIDLGLTGDADASVGGEARSEAGGSASAEGDAEGSAQADGDGASTSAEGGATISISVGG